MRSNGVIRRSKTNGPGPLCGGSNTPHVLPMINQDYSNRKLPRIQEAGSLWRSFTKHYIWNKSDRKSNCVDSRKSVNILTYAVPSSLLVLLLFYLLANAISTSFLSHNANLLLPWIRHPTTVRISNSLYSDLDNHEIMIERFAQPRELPILILSHNSPDGLVPFHHEATISILESSDIVDLGGLYIDILEEDEVARVIYHDFWQDEGEVRDYSKRDDSIDQYYAYDDDYLRSPFVAFKDDTIQDNKRCRRVGWYRFNFPNCNTFHEMDSAINLPTYLNYGAYRDVFVYKHMYLSHEQKLVWKQIQFGDEYHFTYENYEFVRMDALVSERLTFSPRIVDIYGHCGLSMLSEWLPSKDLEYLVVPTSGYIKREEVYPDNDVHPRNNITVVDKLLIAKEMAEALAILHGFRDGIIVHDDIQLSQFLYDEKGRIKLNDFNRAEVMLYNEEDQEWCRYRNGPGSGNLRAPEEYVNKPLNEKIDIYSYGNAVYSLLTGLWPFYDTRNQSEFDVKIGRGDKPYIHPKFKTRSKIEGMLVELLGRCWEHNPDNRATIFEIIEILTSALEEL